MTITLDTVRAFAATHSLFATSSVGNAVKRLGFVQADPIQAPARAQDLILRQRVKDYRAGDLERRYPKLKLDEEVLHVYGYMPSTLVPLLHPRPGRRIDREHPTLSDGILDFVKSNGLTSHRDLEKLFGNTRVRGDWGNQAKATTLALDSLHYRGRIRVAHRNGNERFYTVVAREACALSPTERLRELVMVLMGLYAPMSLPAVRMLVARLGYAAPSLDGRRTIVKELLASGELVRAEVDDMPYFWPAKTKFDERDDGQVRLLAPFDPIVYDRVRFEHLWGWLYRFEAYTPAAKRKLGYYALPLLWQHRVIGWANVSVQDGKLRAQAGFVNGRPTDKAFKLALDEELARMRYFLGVD